MASAFRAQRQFKPKYVSTSDWKNRHRVSAKLHPDTATRFEAFKKQHNLNTNESINLIVAAYFEKNIL